MTTSRYVDDLVRGLVLLQQLLGWQPEIDVRDGIHRTIEHHTRILGQPAAR